MSLIKHSCANCDTELEFPEQLERVRCPRCNALLLVEIYQNVVILKKLKEDSPPPLNSESGNYAATNIDLREDIRLLERQIDEVNRQLNQRRSSAASSLSVAILFFFFTLSSWLVDRALMSLFCSTITLVMVLVAGGSLRESARSRSSLGQLMVRREQLLRELRPNIPRIF